MGASIIRRGRSQPVRKHTEGGFTLIEVMISMVVLTIGLVSLAGVFGLAMVATQTSQQDMIAKLLANEALESIFTARNTSQLNWDDIQNTGSTNCPNSASSPCGIFLAGMNPIYNAGADGIYGTSDDAAAGVETLREPGPGGVYGDTDDVILPLTGYQRNILISAVTDSNNNPVSTLRSVTITVQYTTPQMRLPKSYVLNTFISQYQ